MLANREATTRSEAERRSKLENLLNSPPSLQSVREELDRHNVRARCESQVARFKQELRRRYEFEASQITDLDKMTGEKFEAFLADMFRRKGYNVQQTPKSRDYGVDLIVERGGERFAVQCKRRSPESRQGPAAIQEVYSGKVFYGCEGALVVINAYFSEQAKEMAAKLKVELWDRHRLIAELAQTQTRMSWEEYLRRYYC